MVESIPTDSIEILWCGTLCDTCKTILFTTPQDRSLLQYEMVEDIRKASKLLDKSGAASWIMNYKPFKETGDILLLSTKPTAELISAVTAKLELHYIAHTARAYTKELKHGYLH